MNKFINKSNFGSCCEIINSLDIYIKDFSDGQSKLVNNGDFDFQIRNELRKELSFLKIDKCVYDDSDNEKCDCAIADENLIFFIEIKELEEFGNHLKKNKKRRKAKSQLINTIINFKNLFPDINLINVFPVIALKPKIEDGYVSLITTKDQNSIDEFIEKCGCPNIFEGNYIEFKK